MEDRYQHTSNGQSVLQADLNVMGEAAALADDRVFAELFRMAPFDGANIARGVLPYAHQKSGSTPLIRGNGASGSVLVSPFRAFVGSRTAVATNGKQNLRDTRSALAVGATTLAQVVNIPANTSGLPRWDLVYAAVAVDAQTATVSRKKKDPASKVISAVNVVTRLATTVTLSVQAGTPNASPTWPAAPSDAGGVYFIPIAYVQVPNGFGASSTAGFFAVVAPILRLSRATGARSISVADSHHTLQSSGPITAAKVATWGSVGTPPAGYLPSTLTGGDSLLVFMDLRSPQTTHANGDVIDSRDWRGRLSKFIVLPGGGSADFAWRTTGVVTGIPELSGGSPNSASGFGQSVTPNDYQGGSPVPSRVARADGNVLDIMPSSTLVEIYCDHSDGGKLKVAITGAPNCCLIFWIDFTGVVENPF